MDEDPETFVQARDIEKFVNEIDFDAPPADQDADADDEDLFDGADPAKDIIVIDSSDGEAEPAPKKAKAAAPAVCMSEEERAALLLEKEANWWTGKGSAAAISDDVKKFWEQSLAYHPRPARTAIAVVTSACSEASVERLFSAFGWLKNKRRNKLSEQTTDDQLKIRTNYARLVEKKPAAHRKRYRESVYDAQVDKKAKKMVQAPLVAVPEAPAPEA